MLAVSKGRLIEMSSPNGKRGHFYENWQHGVGGERIKIIGRECSRIGAEFLDKMLVVDDEPDVADLFRQRFRREARQGTYVLHFAASGEEALNRLSNGVRPELIVILSDINMPGMDGMSLLREIK